MFRNAALASGLLASLILRAMAAVAPAAEPKATEPSAGEIIVYTGLRPANWDLYVFPKSGMTPQRLTDHPSPDYNAVFSPDGRYVVFCSERRGNPDLFVLDLQQPGPPRLLLGSDAMEDAPAFSPDGQTLAFVSTRDGNADVFVMPFRPEEPQPPEAVNLTRHPSGDFNPAFSPDGEWIAFCSNRDEAGAGELYVMRRDGTQVRRLTTAEGWDGSPCWSADGATLYYYAHRSGRSHLRALQRDSGESRALGPEDRTALWPCLLGQGRVACALRHEGKWRLAALRDEPDAGQPQWLCDGQRDYWAPDVHGPSGRIVCHGPAPDAEEAAFRSSTPGPFLIEHGPAVLPDRTVDLWAVRGYFPALGPRGELASDEGFERIVVSRLDGSQRRNVFERPGLRTWRPSWSQDGEWIVASAGPTFAAPNARVDLWKFRPDGTEAVNLTRDLEGNHGFPDFSPDGQWIVFRSGRDGNHELYLMRSDGTGLRRLTEHEAVDTMPAFSPRGNQIAFVSTRDGGDYELYLLPLDKEGRPGEPRRVTHSPGRDTHPKFSPDGQWLVFASQRGGLNDESPLIPIFNPQPYGEIFALRLEDGHTVRLTHNKWEDGTPTWKHFQVAP